MWCFRWNDQEWCSFAVTSFVGHLTNTISQMSAIPVQSYDSRAAKQQHIGSLCCHETQRTGGRHAKALTATQAYLGSVKISSGFPKGDDHCGFSRRTGFKTWAAEVKPQQVGLHTVILEQTALQSLPYFMARCTCSNARTV